RASSRRSAASAPPRPRRRSCPDRLSALAPTRAGAADLPGVRARSDDDPRPPFTAGACARKRLRAGRGCDTRSRMPKRVTRDHGEIIHFAGRLKLFPVAGPGGEVRLAAREDVKPDEKRIGWPAYFRPFIDRRLVFLYYETGC